MKRAKLRGLQRNAAVVLGNTGTADDVPLLETNEEREELRVRDHAAWALTAIRRQAQARGAQRLTP